MNKETHYELLAFALGYMVIVIFLICYAISLYKKDKTKANGK
jgi:cbb3-type cytochrome oxidase subunit 3